MMKMKMKSDSNDENYDDEELSDYDGEGETDYDNDDEGETDYDNCDHEETDYDNVGQDSWSLLLYYGRDITSV